MQGGSSKSLQEVFDKTSEVLTGGADAHKLGTDLFSLALSLDGSHSLRRALTEPGGADRGQGPAAALVVRRQGGRLLARRGRGRRRAALVEDP